MVVIAAIPNHDETKLTNFLEISEKTNGLVPKLVGLSSVWILVLVPHGLSSSTQIRPVLKGDYQPQSSVDKSLSVRCGSRFLIKALHAGRTLLRSRSRLPLAGLDKTETSLGIR